MVGICGRLYDLLIVSLQTLNLVREGEMASAGLNIGGSVVLCLAAVWLGHVGASAMNALKGS